MVFERSDLMTKEDKWDLILKIAEKLGVNYEARIKWRQRNCVPHKWRFEIVTKSDAQIFFVDFARMDKENEKKA
jgi:hypothetical protein